MDELVAAARGLAVDAVTAETVTALRAADVRPIVLKGPAIAGLLYQGEPRAYVDTDLLVRPGDIAAARRVLGDLGFAEQPLRIEPELGRPHARAWVREADRAEVDLHELVAGAGVSPEKLWTTLHPHTQALRIGGVDCRVPAPHALVLIVALHAAQHGPDVVKPLEDLGRAVARIEYGTWLDAVRLADALDATVNFASALRFTPEGSALAERLGLPSPRLVDAARSTRSPAGLALGFERLAAARGLGDRLALLRRELVPSPEHMRWWSGLARRGRAGLTVAYVWRLLRLAVLTPSSVVLWARERRRMRDA